MAHQHIQPLGRHQIAILHYVVQRQFKYAVAKETTLISAYPSVVMEMINPSLAQPVGYRGKTDNAKPRIHLTQMADYLLILN